MEKLFLYNSLSRKNEEFKPIVKGKVEMYTCGPTVYGVAHIRNLRSVFLSDLLRRVLMHDKYKFTSVMNITDVDDKTIRSSREESVSLYEFTRSMRQYF